MPTTHFSFEKDNYLQAELESSFLYQDTPDQALASEDVKRDMVAVDTFKKAGVSSEQVPEAVTNALTRDYSDLMKAMNKKGK